MNSTTAAEVMVAKNFDALRGHANRFAAWWLAEFHATLPQRCLFWIDGVSRPTFHLSLSKQGLVTRRLNLPSGQKTIDWDAANFGPKALAALLASHRLRRQDVTLIAAFPADAFFRRDLMVPKPAMQALQSIIEQEILHRTPFQSNQIWHAAVPADPDTAGEIVHLYHWIIRRDHVADHLQRAGLTVDDIDAIAVDDADGSSPMIWLSSPVPSHAPSVARIIRWLTAAATAAPLLAFATILLIQAHALGRVDSEIEELMKGDAALRNGTQGMQLYARKAAPGAVEVWGELSMLLPDHTFLTELRLSDGVVTITGLSSNAAQLVWLVEQSPLFTAVHLTGAITPDPAEQKDRFSLAFRIRDGNAPQQLIEASAARRKE